MILSQKAILQEIKSGRLAITPFNPKNVGPASIDLTLDNEFRVFDKSDEPLTLTPDLEAGLSRSRVVRIADRDAIVIQPNQMVLGVTKERVTLPDYLTGRLEGRSRFARQGLLVHISSSVVAPGVDNVQVLEMYNLAPYPLLLKPGLLVCQLVIERLEGTGRYQGEFRKQRGV